MQMHHQMTCQLLFQIRGSTPATVYLMSEIETSAITVATTRQLIFDSILTHFAHRNDQKVRIHFLQTSKKHFRESLAEDVEILTPYFAENVCALFDRYGKIFLSFSCDF